MASELVDLLHYLLTCYLNTLHILANDWSTQGWKLDQSDHLLI